MIFAACRRGLRRLWPGKHTRCGGWGWTRPNSQMPSFPRKRESSERKTGLTSLSHTLFGFLLSHERRRRRSGAPLRTGRPVGRRRPAPQKGGISAGDSPGCVLGPLEYSMPFWYLRASYGPFERRQWRLNHRTVRCKPPPFFPVGFAAGAGGTGTLSRAAISALVSFSLGLDRPSSKLLLVMLPRGPGSPGLVRSSAVTLTEVGAWAAKGREASAPLSGLSASSGCPGCSARVVHFNSAAYTLV